MKTAGVYELLGQPSYVLPDTTDTSTRRHTVLPEEHSYADSVEVEAIQEVL